MRRDGNIVGICMGDMVIKSGMGQFFAAEPLADIEIPFDDICGLYIGGKQGERMFASQWDDMPFDTKRSWAWRNIRRCCLQGKRSAQRRSTH